MASDYRSGLKSKDIMELPKEELLDMLTLIAMAYEDLFETVDKNPLYVHVDRLRQLHIPWHAEIIGRRLGATIHYNPLNYIYTVNSATDVSCQVSFEIVLDGKVWEIWENQSVSSDSLDFIYQKILKIREERSNS